MATRLTLLAAGAAALAVLPVPRAADAKPTALAVQGQLRATGGGPVSDGDYGMAVALYETDKSPAPMYLEKFLGVAVKGGVFALDLGVTDPTKQLDDALLGAAAGKPMAAWVSVQVGADAEMPRVPLRPVVAAVRARAADTAFGLDCSGCVSADALGKAAVTGDKIAVGAVGANHVSFNWAAADAAGGSANFALAANSAKVADSAKNADNASFADEAGAAKFASSLKCTGCVGVDQLATAVPADWVAAGKLAKVATSGKFADLQGGPDLTGYGALAAKNTWSDVQTLAAGANFAEKEALLFRFQNSGKDPVPCTAKNIGLTYYNLTDQTLRVCNGKDFVTFAQASVTGSADNPAASCQAVLKAAPTSKSGLYWIKPKATAFQAYCEMDTAGGGWTLNLNLDTSDGHVSWWADAIWTDGQPYGDVATPFDGDHKSPAFMDMAASTEVMVVVHEQGIVKGWRSWSRPDGKSLHSVMTAGGDNAVIGNTVTGVSVGGLPDIERFVRITNGALYGNHCFAPQGVSCTLAGGGGSSDGDRIGSNEATPADNKGGALGNWHDISYCCAGKSYAGKSCNGEAFRTTSEAQSAWGNGCEGNPTGGYFGTDTFGVGSGACNNNGGCQFAAWAAPSGANFDYAIYLR